MSQSILNVSSNQPFAPIENVRAVGAQPSVADVSDKALSEIYAEYKKLFVDTTVDPAHKYPTGTSYPDLLKGALYRLGYIISLDTIDKYGDDFNKLSEIYADSRTPDGKAVDDTCREGYMALRFYVKSIVDYLEMLNMYIQEAQAALEELRKIIDMPDIGQDKKLEFAREPIDKLSVCKTFADETVDALVIVGDGKDMLYEDGDTRSQIRTITDYGKLEDLRTTLIAYKDSDKTIMAPIKVFGSLSLIDRMKFIYYYYRLIAGGCTDYTRFPDDKETGYPCIPDVNPKEGEAAKHLGALEMFYVGYLTDRDGPINAVSSFFEIKVQALRENLSIQSKSISALNTYLEFINRGLNVLNASQSGASDYQYDEEKKRTGGDQHAIPNGCMVAVIYLLGGEMYNLAEASDGTKCLVLKSVEGNKPGYLLVSADNAGMNFLIGDSADTTPDGRDHNGNAHTNVDRASDNSPWYGIGMAFAEHPDVYHYASEKQSDSKWNDATKDFGSTLSKPPIRIDCANVIPASVKEYKNFHLKDQIKTEVVSSWSEAFTTKTKFINTAIDTINTDIQVDRSKIDSFDSICSTFRSRAHEAHSNTAANVR